MLKYFIVFFASLGLWTSSAMAITHTFYFDIICSGPDIYTCNAGIRHQSTEQTVCRLSYDPAQSCSPSEQNCVCTSPDQNAYLGNTMTYRKKTWQAASSDWSTTNEESNFNEPNFLDELTGYAAKTDALINCVEIEVGDVSVQGLSVAQESGGCNVNMLDNNSARLRVPAKSIAIQAKKYGVKKQWMSEDQVNPQATLEIF